MNPPSPEQRPSMTPFKKRLLHRVEDSARHYPEEKNDQEYAVEKSKRVEVEYNDTYYDGDGDEDGWAREDVGTGRGDGFGREYMMGRDARKVEEDLSEGNFDDEHGMDQEKFKKERHDVVRERQKKKELEVFVGGLDRDTTDDDLREVFSQVGDITEVRLLMNPMTNKNKGFAFIRFATVEQSRRALTELKRPVINGKQCGVAPSQDSDTLFVGNICKTWTKDMLKDKLVRYGIEKFEELTLVEDTKNEGMNRGFAFLDFPSRADALEACRRLQKRDVVFGTDRTARVAFADTFIEPDDEIMAEVRTVFVDGLPPSWGEEIIKEHLQQFGEIEKVQLARNMPAAKRDDFGFITFDTHENAVSCVDGINDSELVFRDKKVKVRARLSRPRQRGKSAKHARGGYPVGPDGYGGRDSWEPGMNRMETHRFSDRDRRSSRPRSPYDGSHSRSYDSREDRLYEVSFSDRTGSRRPYVASDRPLKRRSPVYERSSFKTDYMRQGDSFGRSRDMPISSTERHAYRDSYSSRGSGYMEDTSRTVSRVSGRKPSHPYDEDDDDGRYVYIDHPSSYHDTGSRNYSSASGLKRPYSTIEERHRSSRRHSRPDLDYDNSSDLFYSERIYGTESTRPGRGSRPGYNVSGQSSAVHSHGQYEKNSSTAGYRRGDISNEDPEEMYARYGREREPREYIHSRSELRAGSYSPVYSNQRVTDGYVGGRVSDSYY